MIDLDAAVKNIREEISKTGSEIKNCIEASEARLLLRIEQLKSTVTKLETENVELKGEVEFLKRAQNKKNILIFGLKKKREEVTAGNLCKDLRDLLGVELKDSDFGDIHPLGKSENCPIKIEFNSNPKKREVLKNCNKLKGKNISIANDLTLRQRQGIKLLRKHLLLARQEGKYEDCYIKGNRLFVDGIAYGIEDLEKEESPEPKHNSAPPTPTVEATRKIAPAQPRVPNTPRISTAKKQVQMFPTQKPTQEKPRTRSVNKN